MTAIFRTLCAELAQQLDDALDFTVSSDTRRQMESLVARARAELAESEGKEPSNEELLQLAIDTRLYRFQATAGDPVQYEMTEQQVFAYARAVLTRWGHPALAPSVPEELSPREVEAQEAFTQIRDLILNLSDGLEVNEVLGIIDDHTPKWV